MLREEQGSDLVVAESAKGRMRMWTLAPGVFCTEATGHIEPDVGEALIEYTERAIQQPEKLHIFHDWRKMKGYAPAVRQRWVRWIGGHLRCYQVIYIASDSSLLSMAATVANLALGKLIHVHPDLAPLEAELTRILARHEPPQQKVG